MSKINSRYRLLVVDIDGTLLDKNGTICTEDKEALTSVSNSGIRVSLSTGRVVQACRKILDQLSLDGYHIFFDGALASDPQTGEEVYVEPISRELVGLLIEYARKNELDLELYSSTRYFIERETWASDIRHKFFNLQPIIVNFAQIWSQERIIKGALTAYSPEEKARTEVIYRQLRDSLSFSWTKTPAYPGVDFINVLAPEVSKGKALEALVSHLGISLAEVIAIGDGSNDVPLLSKAGLAVAMNNATDELKAVADYVTLDVDHNGVAKAVNKFLI